MGTGEYFYGVRVPKRVAGKLNSIYCQDCEYLEPKVQSPLYPHAIVFN
jgi:hypothetical protein